MQQWAAVNTKFLWMTVPPQRLERSLSSVKNSSRTIQSQDSRTVIPLTTRRFLFLIVFEFSNMEQYCKSSSKISVTGWKHGNLVSSAFWHSFSSNSNPLQPYCLEQTRRRDDLHDPRHSVHCDQVAEKNLNFQFSRIVFTCEISNPIIVFEDVRVYSWVTALCWKWIGWSNSSKNRLLISLIDTYQWSTKIFNIFSTEWSDLVVFRWKASA